MATLNRNRGQLIVITGLLVAVALVVLVLLLNAAIYTENLSTRGVDNDASDAVEFQSSLGTNLGETMDRENAQGYSEGNVDDAVRNSIGYVVDETSAHRLERGAVVDTRDIETEPGFLVRQTESDPFADSDESVLVTDADDTREFVLTVEEIPDDDDPFTVTVGTNILPPVIGIQFWELEIYEDDGDVIVEVDDDSKEMVYKDDWDGDLTVDVTGDRIDGETVDLKWPADEDDYDIGFENGNRTNGTYEFTVDGDANPTGNLDEDWWHAVYSLEVDLYYETPALKYETSVRVAPGEADA